MVGLTVLTGPEGSVMVVARLLLPEGWAYGFDSSSKSRRRG